MKIVILSVSDHAKYVYYNITRCGTKRYDVVAFVVETCDEWGHFFEGQEIISPGRAYRLYKDKHFEKFLIPSLEENINKRMYQLLRGFHVPEDDILYADRLSIYSVEDSINFPMYANRLELDTIEFHVSDTCNLNCKYCSMFSALAQENSFPDINAYCRDLKQLKKYFRSVKRVKLLGGEPFLNSELGRTITLTREVYPFAKIIVVTNGLLIKSISRSLIEILRNNDVELIISYYKILGEKIEDIHHWLYENSIRHRITSCITDFYKMYDLSGNQDGFQNFQFCNCKEGCATIRDGKLMSCFVPSVIDIASRSLCLDINVKDYIDLFDPSLSVMEIWKRFQTPMESCKYCLPKGVKTEWESLGDEDAKAYGNWSI